jgi:hypothetical protein
MSLGAPAGAGSHVTRRQSLLNLHTSSTWEQQLVLGVCNTPSSQSVYLYLAAFSLAAQVHVRPAMPQELQSLKPALVRSLLLALAACQAPSGGGHLTWPVQNPMTLSSSPCPAHVHAHGAALPLDPGGPRCLLACALCGLLSLSVNPVYLLLHVRTPVVTW